ncbi:MAG: nodulation protein NfeD [Candidatus Marinimicrobia bacterium]|nr:nodulation protein NfeD [Candidatus Neomarinimicrobiota bacterium]
MVKMRRITKTIKISVIMLSIICVNLSGKEIWILEYDGIINPIASKYVLSNLNKADTSKVECLIIKLDTPGGLMSSMRDIIKGFLNSDIPIVVYIYPRGAQAASAGVFITVAAHIAAMSPGTNIGAAHPVNLGGGGIFGGKPDSANTKTMMEKVTNDAVAFIKSIAHERGRNEQWVEDAVRKSVSITETEALEKNVIDIIANDTEDLIARINGKKVKVKSSVKIIKTTNARIVERPIGWHFKILNTISDPNIAYLFLILGFYGLFFELSNPGSIFPGVLGAIFLILAFFSFQILPINYAGLALIAIGIILFILEVKITSYGLLTIGGIISMIIGSMMLINTQEAPKQLFSVSLQVIIPIVVITAILFILALSLALKTHKKKVSTGREGLIGSVGSAITDIDKEGMVLVHGEYWKAKSNIKINKGDKIKVIGIDQMVLKVEKLT